MNNDALSNQIDTKKSAFKLRTFKEILESKPPKELIEDFIPEAGFVSLCGEPAAYKTSFALSMCHAITQGREFAHGRKVTKGKVLYITDEGQRGFTNRCMALQEEFGETNPEDFLFINDGLQLIKKEKIKDLLETLKEQNFIPNIIVIDTLARSMVGIDENGTKDFSIVIENIDILRKTIGSTVFVIHHMTKGGKRERGSSVLHGALDTMIYAKKVGSLVEITCAKQKDMLEFKPFYMQYKPVPIEDSKPCGVILDASYSRFSQKSKKSDGSESTQKAWNIFTENFLLDGATYSEWRDMCNFDVEKTFQRAVKFLEDQGYVSRPHEKSKGEKYTITELGTSKITDIHNGHV